MAALTEKNDNDNPAKTPEAKTPKRKKMTDKRTRRKEEIAGEKIPEECRREKKKSVGRGGGHRGGRVGVKLLFPDFKRGFDRRFQ